MTTDEAAERGSKDGYFWSEAQYWHPFYAGGELDQLRAAKRSRSEPRTLGDLFELCPAVELMFDKAARDGYRESLAEKSDADSHQRLREWEDREADVPRILASAELQAAYVEGFLRGVH
jgi:hypothetical protein